MTWGNTRNRRRTNRVNQVVREKDWKERTQTVRGMTVVSEWPISRTDTLQRSEGDLLLPVRLPVYILVRTVAIKVQISYPIKDGNDEVKDQNQSVKGLHNAGQDVLTEKLPDRRKCLRPHYVLMSLTWGSLQGTDRDMMGLPHPPRPPHRCVIAHLATSSKMAE